MCGRSRGAAAMPCATAPQAPAPRSTSLQRSAQLLLLVLVLTLGLLASPAQAVSLEAVAAAAARASASAASAAGEGEGAATRHFTQVVSAGMVQPAAAAATTTSTRKWIGSMDTPASGASAAATTTTATTTADGGQGADAAAAVFGGSTGRSTTSSSGSSGVSSGSAGLGAAQQQQQHAPGSAAAAAAVAALARAEAEAEEDEYGVHPRALRVYVQELPDRFTFLYAPITPSKLWGFGSYGAAIDPTQQMWIAGWHDVDSYFVGQMSRSPLRVYDPKDADVVVVALLTLKISEEHDRKLHQELLDNAASLLPLLGTTPLPHVLFVSHPLSTYLSYRSPLVKAAERLNLTLVTNTVRDFMGHTKVKSYAPYVAMPYFQYTHWSPATSGGPRRDGGADADAAGGGSGGGGLGGGGVDPALGSRQAFDEQAMRASKPLLLSQSFVVRGIVHPGLQSRSRDARNELYMQCVAAGNGTCRHFWVAPSDHGMAPADTAALQRQTASAWFCNQPRGDFVSRSSYVDAIVAASVPVFPLRLRQMQGFLPYTDVLDWSRFSVSVEDGEWDANCTCQQPPPAAENADRPCSCEGRTLLDVLRSRFPGGGDDVLPLTRALWRVRQVFQFSTEPVHTLARWDTRRSLDPNDDAFTFTLKALMRSLCRRRRVPDARCSRAPN